MATPHFNYYPPSGSVQDTNEPKAFWNGKEWRLNNKKYNVPSGHHLTGRSGTQMDGWIYDWGKRAWMEPDRGRSSPTAMTPRPQPARPAPTPQPQPAKPAQPEKEKSVDKCASKDKEHTNVLEYLMKHPIAPLAGAVVLLGSMMADEPVPPSIPDGLPEPIQKQWLMIYNQNQQRFQRRMQIWDTVGKALLGYSDTNAILAALPARKVG
ncbi:MAG TPA: hypothetical protein VGL86_22015 [Polyangia bacterium]|jgi:hypothetical protein